MAEKFDIEEIERYLEHRMSAAEQRSFEQRMEKDNDLKAETKAYQQLLNGLYTLGSERLRPQIQSWEQEWKKSDTDDSELIEWYLNNELGEAGKAMVQGRMKSDPGFAKAVEQQGSLNQGFKALQHEQFAEKIKAWEKDKEQSAVRSSQPTIGKERSRFILLRRIAAAIALFLAVSTVVYWYADSNYSRQAVTKQLYQPVSSEATMGDAVQSTSVLAKSLESAHQLMQEGQYEAAFLAFNRLLGQIDNLQLDDFNRQYFTEQAEWQRLLAAQAMTPPPLELKKEAKRIANTEGHNFQEESAQLLQKMDTFLYGLVN